MQGDENVPGMENNVARNDVAGNDAKLRSGGVRKLASAVKMWAEVNGHRARSAGPRRL